MERGREREGGKRKRECDRQRRVRRGGRNRTERRRREAEGSREAYERRSIVVGADGRLEKRGRQENIGGKRSGKSRKEVGWGEKVW